MSSIRVGVTSTPYFAMEALLFGDGDDPTRWRPKWLSELKEQKVDFAVGRFPARSGPSEVRN